MSVFYHCKLSRSEVLLSSRRFVSCRFVKTTDSHEIEKPEAYARARRVRKRKIEEKKVSDILLVFAVGAVVVIVITFHCCSSFSSFCVCSNRTQWRSTGFHVQSLSRNLFFGYLPNCTSLHRFIKTICFFSIFLFPQQGK